MSNGQITVPLVMRMAGGAGSQLGAQHSHSLEGWYAHVPGLKVVVPVDSVRREGPAHDAPSDDENPVVFIEHTALTRSKGEVPDEPVSCCQFGRAECMREGTDVTLIGYSGSVHQAFRAADMTSLTRASRPRCSNLRTLRPLDVEGDRYDPCRRRTAPS